MAKSWFTIEAKGDKAAQINIHGDIGWSFRFADFDREFAKLGKGRAINLSISSPGGDVFTGFAVYDRLRAYDGKVVVTIDGLAASMGSVIAMAGDEIIMPENAQLMIHNPVGMVEGGVDELKSFANALGNMQENIVRAYAERSGLKPEKVQAMMDETTWLTAERAVELGFATKVAAPVKMAAHAGFDLSHFKNVPQSLGRESENEDDHMAEKDRSEEIKRLCKFAGKADLADGFISQKLSVTDVLTKLEEAKTAEDAAVAEAAKKAAATNKKDDTDGKPAVDADEIRKQVIAEHNGIRALCKLAGFPDKADGFITAQKSREDVIAALDALQAEKTEQDAGKNGGRARASAKKDTELNTRHAARGNAEDTPVLDTSKIYAKMNSAGSKSKAA